MQVATSEIRNGRGPKCQRVQNVGTNERVAQENLRYRSPTRKV